MFQLPPVAQAIAVLLGVALAIVRLLTASRPFWNFLPNKLQKALPALMVALGLVPTALASAKSWLDVVTAAILVVGTYFTGSRGDQRPPLDKDGDPKLERVNSDPKLSPEETLKVGPLLVLLLLGFAVHQQGCATSKPPCNEDKMRAIDAAYLSDIGKACLSYPDAASCPEYLPLKAKHERDLESCPQ